MKHSIQLPNPPQDIITSISIYRSNAKSSNSNSNSNLKIIVTSFKGQLYIYDISNVTLGNPTSLAQILNPEIISLNNEQDEETIPILDSTIIDKYLYLGLINGEIVQFVITTSQIINSFKVHDLGVQSLLYNSKHNLLISGSWDGYIALIDPTNFKIISKINLNSRATTTGTTRVKVQKMDTLDNNLLIITSNSKTLLFNIPQLLANTNTPTLEQETAFKYPLTTSLSLLPNNQGFIQGSIEGKVSVEFFPSYSSSNTNYAFKAHRKRTTDDIELTGPINDIIFINKEGNNSGNNSNTNSDNSKFVTCGNQLDGTICIWDYLTKKRVKLFKGFDLDIVRLNYCDDLKCLVVGLSDMGFKNSVGLQNDDSEIVKRDSKVLIRFI